MDNLITEKIEKEIEDLDGIKKITSTSGVGVSSVVIELENDTNVRDTMTDIRDALDTLSLPEDAQDPKVQEISTMSELMFQALLYAPEDKISSFELNVGAKKIQNALEGKYGIVSIDIGAGSSDGGVGVS